jgi:hypothetical protein
MGNKGVARFAIRQVTGLVLVVGLFGLVGCKQKGGDVSGVVKLDGTPVAFAKINFIGKGNKTASGNTSEAGKYNVKGVPLGDVAVTVETKTMRDMINSLHKAEVGTVKDKKPTDDELTAAGWPPERREKVKEAESKLVDVPPKYTLPDQTPLKMTVKTGEQTQDFDLKK